MGVDSRCACFLCFALCRGGCASQSQTGEPANSGEVNSRCACFLCFALYRGGCASQSQTGEPANSGEVNSRCAFPSPPDKCICGKTGLVRRVRMTSCMPLSGLQCFSSKVLLASG